jgi:UPF0755 protein
MRALFLVLWLVGTSALAWLMLVFPNQTQRAPSRDVVLEPEPQQDLARLARRLGEAKVIDNELAFIWYMRLLGASEKLRQGPIVINRALSPHDLLPRLAHDFGTSAVRVPIPEGFTSFDIALRLARYGVCAQHAFERAVFDRALLAELAIQAPSAEGYLFPATYELRQDSPAHDAVRAMVRDSAKVPVTSIYSRDDGVVAWQASVDAQGECRAREVESTHLGLMVDPEVHDVVAQELARE